MHGYRTSNRFSALYQVLADTGPASFKADYRPATAGRAVPATPRRQSVSCNDTPFDGLRRAGRRSGKGGAVPTSYTHIHRARQRFAMPSRAYPELSALVGGQVPNLRDRTVWGNGTNTVGTTLSAGLPNITGSAGSGNSTGGYRSPTGAFTSNGSCYSADARFQSPNVYMKFDASLSNSIYGKSTTVQPPARVVRFLIRAKP